MIVHRDLKPANLMLGGIPHETGTREMVRFAQLKRITYSRSKTNFEFDDLRYYIIKLT